MGKLCIYLPPFASDYSGVCSALFDLNCLTVINDANCCTSHFVYYDEPRWTKVQRPILSTQLRSTDAIFGNDKKVTDCVVRAAENVKTDLIAIVGTPVPAMTGMDMDGIACEIEAVCGRPTLGFNTTGHEYYDRGIFAAGSALIDRFCAKGAGAARGINILGMTPLDFGDVGSHETFANALRNAGLEINASTFFNTSLADIKRLPDAACNLATSSSGLLLAKKLNRRYGTPYIPCCPMGTAHFQTLLKRLRDEAWDTARPAGGGRLLLIGDQIMMSSLREALYLSGCQAEICVSSFFCWDRDAARPCDFHIASERSLIEQLRKNEINRVICDPQLARLPAISALPHKALVHPAVSSRLEWANTSRYLSDDFDSWLAEAAEWGSAV